MSPTRREFLGQSLAAAAAGVAAASLGTSCRHETSHVPTPTVRKRILILGGTGFLGPKTFEVALARGHHVTIFNRGKRKKLLPFPFKNVEHLYGNRDPLLPADDERGPDKELLHSEAQPKGLEQLQGKTWDAVIDNSGYYPRMVEASAELLAPNAMLRISVFIAATQLGGRREVGAQTGRNLRPRESTRSAACPPYWAIFPMLRPPARGTAGLEDRSRAPSEAPAGMPHRHIGRALSAGRLR